MRDASSSTYVQVQRDTVAATEGHARKNSTDVDLARTATRGTVDHMIPRERVLTAFEHREADAVPVDFSGHRSSGIAGMTYAHLRDHLGLPARPVRIHDPIQQIAVVDPDVLDRFGVDTIELGRGFAARRRRTGATGASPTARRVSLPPGCRSRRDDGAVAPPVAEGHGARRACPTARCTSSRCTTPSSSRDDLDGVPKAFEECMWTSSAAAAPPGPGDGREELPRGRRRLRERTDRAIVGLFGGNLLECGQFLYRNDSFFLLLAGEPDRAERFLDRLVELHLANLERFLAAVGEFIDVILFGDDLGMQSGPQISPAMYRRVLQAAGQLWKTAKQLAPAKGGRCGAPLASCSTAAAASASFSPT